MTLQPLHVVLRVVVTAVRYACGLHLYVYRHGLLSIESSEVELDIGISGGGKAELYWNGLKS